MASKRRKNIRDTASLLELTNALIKDNDLSEQQSNLGNEWAIAIIDDDTWELGHFTLTGIGLQIPIDISQESMYDLGRILTNMERATQFWVGDWANWFIRDAIDDFDRGRIYQELADDFGIERHSLHQYASVCRILDPSMRIEGLSFTHHTLIAFLPENLKGREREFLEASAEEGWSVRELRQQILKASENLELEPQIEIHKTPFENVPNLRSKVLEKHYYKALQGDDKSRKVIDAELAELERWMQRVKDSLDK